jgi:hypothetical protein
MAPSTKRKSADTALMTRPLQSIALEAGAS